MLRESQIPKWVVRAPPLGFELQAGPWNGKFVAEQLDLTTAKGVVTPGTDDQDEDNELANELLHLAEATAFGGMAARCNYLSVDRADILFPIKELRTEMIAPTSRSMA